MNMKRAVLGTTLATVVALAFVASSYASSDQVARKWVKCYGVNSCRGQSACRLTTNTCKVINTCKGQNACRGQGFVFKSPQACKDMGGTTPETPDALKNL